ncbi:hypothetical protein LWI29_035064 [Acer saccharum]|uniref:Uncharacterized protein n=1 Tax=Acer saccharum TaxID=4024 RepID=A0AA39S4F1_ACESA|nr:hypothetical protein LWI29_035064 [Acer saccharum]
MGAKVDKSINKRYGPYVFKINGQVHHLMGSLLPLDGECPKFAQLYIYDTDNEVKNRVDILNQSNKNDKLDDEIVGGLIQMLDQTIELVKLFRIAKDKVKSDSIDCTDNEVKNRVDILNQSNKNDKLDDEIVDGLIQMLDQTIELVKLFRIAKDKVKSDSIDCFRLSRPPAHRLQLVVDTYLGLLSSSPLTKPPSSVACIAVVAFIATVIVKVVEPDLSQTQI